MQAWLTAILRHGAGRVDAALLAEALKPDADLAALAAMAGALAPSRERWEETIAQGRAFGYLVNRMTASRWPEMAYPVAVGAAARRLRVEPARVVALFLAAQTCALVQVAVRFVPLGQSEGRWCWQHCWRRLQRWRAR